MGIIEDNKLKRKDQDKPLGSMGAKDTPKGTTSTIKSSITKKREEHKKS